MSGSRFEKRQRESEKTRAAQLLFGDVSDAFYLLLEVRRDLIVLQDIRQQSFIDRIGELKTRLDLGKSRECEVVSTETQHRNLRDTLILVGLFFLISIIFTYIFFRMQENRFKMEVTNRALEIINKQLRCDIENYKCIETKLKNLRNPGKDSP